MSNQTTYIDVILPLAVPNLYTYRVPVELVPNLQIGQRVVVQFGKKKLYSAVVRLIHNIPPEKYVPKEVHEILDDFPVVTELQLKFWEWMRAYYLCTPGDVLVAALPNGLKLSSETRLVLREDADYNDNDLTDNEFMVVEALEINRVLTLEEVSEIISRKTVYPLIKSLIEKQVIMVLETLKESYKPKMETYVQLSAAFEGEEALRVLYDKLSRAPKQQAILMKYTELSRMFSEERQLVKKNVLLKESDASLAQLKALVEKGVFETKKVQVDRATWKGDATIDDFELSVAQKTAYNDIKARFDEQEVVLLHGVTSSGKTEIYIKLIQEAVARGKQVLYLLPEIALTTQIITRLRKHFGEQIGIYHSRFNQHERVEVWKKMLSEKRYDIVLGARSALFLPFENLGLVIVDEAHDTSFKQYDPAPRYNARDSAIVLARLSKAKVLLGSATPSVESHFNADKGKYGMVKLTTRYGGVEMPEIVIANLKEEHKRKTIQGNFSSLLVNKIKGALSRNEQVILFQNRRGFSPFIICQTCGWTPYCQRCDVGLTYHKHLHRLKCHYCGYETYMPRKCVACGSDDLALKGFGTEKIEEDLELMFPDAKIGRMDLDTTRSKYGFQRIINDFEDHNIDILVGTQMVTKGLDFENVSLVGILNADQALNFQDFRAHERSYQMMAQVAGRSGRKSKQGKVVIQTFEPDHPIISDVVHNRYENMYHRELSDRKKFFYPPYCRLIRLTVKHHNKEKLMAGADALSEILGAIFGNRVLGPEFPPVGRVRNQYINHFYLKIERKAAINKVKHMLGDCLSEFRSTKEFRAIIILIDVDPG